jgi:hypothetical protein
MDATDYEHINHVTLSLSAINGDPIRNLFNGTEPATGVSYEVLPQVQLRVLGRSSQRGWGQPETLQSALDFAANVSVDLIATWLVQKLAGRKAHLQVGGQAVETTNVEEIARLLSSAQSQAPSAGNGTT